MFNINYLCLVSFSLCLFLGIQGINKFNLALYIFFQGREGGGGREKPLQSNLNPYLILDINHLSIFFISLFYNLQGIK